MADTKLLDRVRAHNQTYFRSGWAHYETAVSGGFRLLPSSERQAHIERDYHGMADMFMATPPKFEQILTQLKIMESRINGA